jgi:hypothetical protein
MHPDIKTLSKFKVAVMAAGIPFLRNVTLPTDMQKAGYRLLDSAPSDWRNLERSLQVSAQGSLGVLGSVAGHMYVMYSREVMKRFPRICLVGSLGKPYFSSNKGCFEIVVNTKGFKLTWKLLTCIKRFQVLQKQASLIDFCNHR